MLFFSFRSHFDEHRKKYVYILYLYFSNRRQFNIHLILPIIIKLNFFFLSQTEAALTPKAAGCTVELQTISLKDTDDPSLYYYPPCTRVNRCGGCCAHDLLACQPTKSETLNFEVNA